MEQAQGKFTSMLPTQDVNTARHLLQQHQDIKKSEYQGRVPKHRDRAQTGPASDIQAVVYKAVCINSMLKLVLFAPNTYFLSEFHHFSCMTWLWVQFLEQGVWIWVQKFGNSKNYDLQARSDISFMSLDKKIFDWKSLCILKNFALIFIQAYLNHPKQPCNKVIRFWSVFVKWVCMRTFRTDTPQQQRATVSNTYWNYYKTEDDDSKKYGNSAGSV